MSDRHYVIRCRVCETAFSLRNVLRSTVPAPIAPS
jgi:hypothetical protein